MNECDASGAQVNPRRLPALQPRRPSKTSKLENLLLSDPNRVKVVRKNIDHQSGKLLVKPAKLVPITDHTHVTDNVKVYRKKHICLKPKSRYNTSVGQNTLSDRLQASNPTFHGAVKRTATRSQPVMLEQQPNNPNLSAPMLDLTVDSSSGSSIGSNGGLQVVQDFTPVEKQQKFQNDSPPIKFAHQPKRTSQHQNSKSATLSSPTCSTTKLPSSSTSSHPQTTHCATSSPTTDSFDKFPGLSPTNPRIMISSPEIVSPQGLVHPSHSASSEPHSSYPSLSLPAQPVLDDSETVRTSLRSKKPT